MKNFLLLLSLLWPVLLWSAHAESLTATTTVLTDAEQQLVAWVAERESKLLEELRSHVEINTGTENIAGLNRYRSVLEKELLALGFKNRLVSSAPLEKLSCAGGQVTIADHLVATRSGEGAKLLLSGHIDTVFSKNDEFQAMTVDDDGVIKGPGVADMKGGIVVMLNALRALDAAGQLQNTNLTVVLNTDEEIGSLGSRALIEQLAADNEVGIVFEGSYKSQLVRTRKGLGQARIKVTGRESHAGAAHAQGASANLELAHKIIKLEALTNYQTESTVNVGVMAGGEKRNTVPGCADAHVDLRYAVAAEGETLKSAVEKIAEHSFTAGELYPMYPKTESWVVLHRPAKAENAQVDVLIQHAMGLSQLLGEPITGTVHSGGGTDGSIMQAAGLPTIDSLGVDGFGAHSSRETTSVASLVARTKLAAVMLSRLLANSDR